ncbi:EF-hand domain-containing protein D1 isoform X3 [Oryzias melastigma]|uniref:EF-hand domain-containing protein D1 isoform X3 n=1 Tax=Oryzias melastigma TaxID=30732 RepID=UPI000CF80963|nr:EF-hand domain-containing protein D1 isoform X3 [Oryzias melastigma]
MASEELAKKLQSRFAAVEDTENRLEPELSPARSAPREPIGGEDCSELSAMLHRRLDINDGAAAPCATRVFNPYTEFKEFSRRQIKDMEAMFRRYDMGKDGFIDLMELKLMMEKLGAPQTHLGLKNMIREVDEDFDGKLSFREENDSIPEALAAATSGCRPFHDVIPEKSMCLHFSHEDNPNFFKDGCTYDISAFSSPGHRYTASQHTHGSGTAVPDQGWGVCRGRGGCH